MSKFHYETLRAEAIAKGEARWMYEPTDEPLPPASAWQSLPFYYTAHVAAKNARVQAILSDTKCAEAFVFFADAHVRQSAMTAVPIIRSILENTDVHDVIYGGDTVSAWATDESLVADVEYFARAYAFAKPYMVRGNHDMYGKAFEYTDTGAVKSNRELYELIFRADADRVIGEDGKTYYYFDHPDTKTRYIVIDTNELLTPVWDARGIWNCDVSITQTQIRWFIDLLGRIPQGWGAVVCGHTPITKQLKWAFPKACIFGDLIEAYNRRDVLNTVSWDGVDAFPVCADFTAAEGRVILNVCGHGHIDDLYASPSGCIYVETHCESVKNNNGGSPFPRVSGTVSETVIDVMILDRNTNRLRIVRYGAGEDREA
ncbi:MAG: metallophosphoesterase [Clostridia bacterium]|nr:metallophosphoesterase [Clostridia bacterium]